MSDRARVAQAAVLLPVVAVALRRWGLQRLQRRLLAVPGGRRRAVPPSGAQNIARRLARVVDVAARRGPWPANCLQRSVVLWWLLHRRGVGSNLQIGVRRRTGSPSGSHTLDFHAWVEHEGVVLNDVADVRNRFATFPHPIAPRQATWRRGDLSAR